MTEMQDTIALELALVEKLVELPDEPFGYGVDVSCVLDIEDDAKNASGLLAFAQHLVRGLITERGTIPDDPDWGMDLASQINKGLTLVQVRELEGKVRAQLTKDDRVLEAAVTLSFSSATIDLKILITPNDPNLIAFELIGAITLGGAIILSLTAL